VHARGDGNHGQDLPSLLANAHWPLLEEEDRKIKAAAAVAMAALHSEYKEKRAAE